MALTYAEWILILDDGRSRDYLKRGAVSDRIDHEDRMWKQVAVNPNVGVASYVPVAHD